MKTLHKFILKSYFGPLILTLFICMFILLMQFLWKYIDDLVGKGLEWQVIAQLLFYASATLVPLALPLSILLSSIMTFGNLGENYELVALKSAGLSLQRIMQPLIFLSLFISAFAFYFANNVLPLANLKMGSLLYDVRDKKPALNIREGVFYNGINGYSLRVGKKDKDGKTLYDVLIYDHTGHFGNNKVIMAQRGKMEMSTDKMFLIVSLHNGYSYEEQLSESDLGAPHPLLRSRFQEETIRLDMSGFKLTRTDEQLFKDNYQMLNIKQLDAGIDSLELKKQTRKMDLVKQMADNYYSNVNKYIVKTDSLHSQDTSGNFLSRFPKANREKMFETAISIAQNEKSFVESIINDNTNFDDSIIRHKVEWHKKFTLSFACLILFFVGAPLGAIIRKGGLGMPMVVTVLFFIIFHVLSIIGEKFSKEGVLPVNQGMWLASAVILPIGIFLTYKATVDSALFDMDVYTRTLKNLFRFKKAV